MPSPGGKTCTRQNQTVKSPSLARQMFQTWAMLEGDSFVPVSISVGLVTWKHGTAQTTRPHWLRISPWQLFLSVATVAKLWVWVWVVSRRISSPMGVVGVLQGNWSQYRIGAEWKRPTSSTQGILNPSRHSFNHSLSGKWRLLHQVHLARVL